MEKIIVNNSAVERGIISEFQSQKLNFELVAVYKKSLHKDDDYLFVAVAKNKNNQGDDCFVVYTYNHSTGSLNHGWYNLDGKGVDKALAEKISYPI